MWEMDILYIAPASKGICNEYTSIDHFAGVRGVEISTQKRKERIIHTKMPNNFIGCWNYQQPIALASIKSN